MTRIRIIIRSLFINRVTSIITIAGFSISISMAMVIIAFLISEYNTDLEFPKIESIYRVIANDNITSVREDFREYFIEHYPAIDDACRYNNFATTVTSENLPFRGAMIITDNSFFQIFSLQFILGDVNSALENLNDVVLTESFARKIFGHQNPLGKTLIAEYKEPLIVTGVVRDFSDNSSIKGDFFTNSKLKIIYEGSSDGQGNEVNFFRLFVLIRDQVSINGLDELLTKDISSIEYKVGYKIEKINLLPFKESYFKQGLNRSQTRHANLKLIRIFSAISTVIVLLAIFNYINLSTAAHSDRLKEIGVKKAIGANRRQIFAQFMAESFMVCFFASLLATHLSILWVPFFERFLDAGINLNILFRPVWLGWILLGVVFVSFISGIYPALSVSGHKPVTILGGKEKAKHGHFGFRAALNTIQNAVSVSLIVTIILLSKQIDFVRTRNFGFDTGQLLRIDLHWRLADKANIIRDKLLADPSIENVSFSHGSPGSIYSTSSWREVEDKDIMMNNLTVDTSFFKVFSINILKGRELVPSDFNKVCYINETAFKMSGWDNYEGRKYNGREIIGIVEDFHYANLYNQIGPLAIQVASDFGISHLSLRVNDESLQRVISTLAEVWKDICPGHELKYQFYDEWFESMYKGEERLIAAIRLFAFLAILISCLGIIGMAEYSIKNRTKEVGIRKVNGARIADILFLLNKDFFKWVLAGFVLSLPVSYYFMNEWLKNFAYRTDLSWWIFAEAGLTATGIALLTVSWQSWRAATRNPVESLRYE